MGKNKFQAFTLVELIVVMAILVILSVIGFISYTGYLRDARNTLRTTELSQIVQAIDLYISTNGIAPRCNTGNVCYFTNISSGADSSKRTSVAQIIATSMNTTDWAKLNFKKAPEDPRQVYYIYAYNADKYAILATKEESSGYSTIAKGTYDYTEDTVAPFEPDQINTLLGLTTLNTNLAGDLCVDGLRVTGVNISPTDDALNGCLLNPPMFNSNPAVVPYRPYPT